MPLLPPCLNPLIYFYKRAYLQESTPSGPGFPCRLPEGRAFAPARTPRETRAPDKSALCMRHGGCAGPGKQSGEQDADWNPFPCAAFLPRCLARQANKDAQGRPRASKDRRTGERATGEPGRPGAGNTANPACPRSFTQAQGIGPSPPGSMPNPALPDPAGPDAGPSPAAGRQTPGKPFPEKPVSGNPFPATPSGERAAPETPGLRPFPSVGRRRS